MSEEKLIQAVMARDCRLLRSNTSTLRQHCVTRCSVQQNADLTFNRIERHTTKAPTAGTNCSSETVTVNWFPQTVQLTYCVPLSTFWWGRPRQLIINKRRFQELETYEVMLFSWRSSGGHTHMHAHSHRVYVVRNYIALGAVSGWGRAIACESRQECTAC